MRLAADLKARGANVWLDQLDLPYGQHWDEQVEQALTACSEMLVILSPAAILSKNVKDEIAFALEDGKVVIPVIHRECRLPLRLGRLHYIDLRVEYEPGLQRLLDALKIPFGIPSPVAGPVAGNSRVNPKDGQTYLYIPPGEFRMGCSEGDSESKDNEKPARLVTLTKGFWLGKTAVTVDAYQLYAKATAKKVPPRQGSGKMPLINVSWDEAKQYCEWVGGRLPTEAEWEYAARAGATTARYGELDDIAWHDGNSEGTLHEVGLQDPNAFGLYDMLGNVWEWVSDWYGPYPDGAAPDPQGPSNGKYRALRGGSWYDRPPIARSSVRVRNEASYRSVVIGVRCGGE